MKHFSGQMILGIMSYEKDYEKDLYRQARKQDAHWYLLALFIIILGFYTAVVSSVVSTSILGIWFWGVSRVGKRNLMLIEEAEPLIKKLISQDFTEHDAMKKVGIDKFHYKPFWAIR
jgi:hypothetical protein